jgi:hypothetical protein
MNFTCEPTCTCSPTSQSYLLNAAMIRALLSGVSGTPNLLVASAATDISATVPAPIKGLIRMPTFACMLVALVLLFAVVVAAMIAAMRSSSLKQLQFTSTPGCCSATYSSARVLAGESNTKRILEVALEVPVSVEVSLVTAVAVVVVVLAACMCAVCPKLSSVIDAASKPRPAIAIYIVVVVIIYIVYTQIVYIQMSTVHVHWLLVTDKSSVHVLVLCILHAT